MAMATLIHPLSFSNPKPLISFPSFRPSSFHFRHRPSRRITLLRCSSDQAPLPIENNPLLQEFDFPPFDVIDASHVRPGMRALLNKLVCITLFVFIITGL